MLSLFAILLQSMHATRKESNTFLHKLAMTWLSAAWSRRYYAAIPFSESTGVLWWGSNSRWKVRMIESVSSIARGRTSAIALILDVLRKVYQLVVYNKQCVGIGADASCGQMRSFTYRILIWLSFIDKPSCSTRLLMAFQPVNLEAKWTYRFMPKSAGFIIS
jgi:hypothetical protein